MKVIGIGLNKTGTKTLKSLMVSNGFRHQSFDLDAFKHFRAGRINELLDWVDRYDSFEDWPWPLIYREIDARFPEAKFVLTVRSSPEVWYRSLCKMGRSVGPLKDFEKHIYGYSMPQDANSIISIFTIGTSKTSKNISLVEMINSSKFAWAINSKSNAWPVFWESRCRPNRYQKSMKAYPCIRETSCFSLTSPEFDSKPNQKLRVLPERSKESYSVSPFLSTAYYRGKNSHCNQWPQRPNVYQPCGRQAFAA